MPTSLVHDGPPLSPHDFAVWWDLVGRWYVPVWIAAAILTVAAVWAARRVVAIDREASPARGLARDLTTHAFAGVAGVAVVAGTYAVFRIFHTRVGLFFFAVGVAFWASALFIPLTVLWGARGRGVLLRRLLSLTPISLATWMLFVEPNAVGVIEGTVKIPSLPNGCSIRIAHLSDIQTLQFSAREERALELANAFGPDLVVITGDLTASGQNPVLVEHLRDWLRRLESKTSRFVVNGDSDGDFDALVAGMPEVTYLKDSGVSLSVNGAKLWLGGIDNRRRPPEARYAFEGAPADATTILLTHNPDFFLSAMPRRAALGLAGHTHGGQVHIPFLGPILTFTHIGPRYAEGIFPREWMESDWPWNVEQMSICPGIGMEGGYAPRVRFLCPPRITLLTLESSSTR